MCLTIARSRCRPLDAFRTHPGGCSGGSTGEYGQSRDSQWARTPRPPCVGGTRKSTYAARCDLLAVRPGKSPGRGCCRQPCRSMGPPFAVAGGPQCALSATARCPFNLRLKFADPSYVTGGMRRSHWHGGHHAPASSGARRSASRRRAQISLVCFRWPLPSPEEGGAA